MADHQNSCRTANIASGCNSLWIEVSIDGGLSILLFSDISKTDLRAWYLTFVVKKIYVLDGCCGYKSLRRLPRYMGYFEFYSIFFSFISNTNMNAWSINIYIYSLVKWWSRYLILYWDNVLVFFMFSRYNYSHTIFNNWDLYAYNIFFVDEIGPHWKVSVGNLPSIRQKIFPQFSVHWKMIC